MPEIIEESIESIEADFARRRAEIEAQELLGDDPRDFEAPTDHIYDHNVGRVAVRLNTDVVEIIDLNATAP